MDDILKGNYELPDTKSGKRANNSRKKKSPESLTDKLEQRALASLGGSMCFVMKGKTFLWTGDDSDAPGS